MMGLSKMMMQNGRQYLLLLAVVMLVGCGTTDVIKRADDTYTVSSQYGSLNGSWDRAAKDAMDKAVAFCDGRRERILVVKELRDGVYGFSPQRVDIIFKCVNDTATTTRSTNTAEGELRTVKSLYEKGLITEMQYNEQVKSILNTK
jgi:hypothetical protein